jgi:hypothetical protein
MKFLKKLFDFVKTKLFKPATKQVQNMNRAERRRMTKAVAKVYSKNLRTAPGVRPSRKVRRLTAKSMAKSYVENLSRTEQQPFSWKVFWTVQKYRITRKLKTLFKKKGT